MKITETLKHAARLVSEIPGQCTNRLMLIMTAMVVSAAFDLAAEAATEWIQPTAAYFQNLQDGNNAADSYNGTFSGNALPTTAVIPTTTANRINTSGGSAVLVDDGNYAWNTANGQIMFGLSNTYSLSGLALWRDGSNPDKTVGDRQGGDNYYEVWANTVATTTPTFPATLSGDWIRVNRSTDSPEWKSNIEELTGYAVKFASAVTSKYVIINYTAIFGHNAVGEIRFFGEAGAVPPTAPVITNAAPSLITSSSVSMNGNLASTGGAPTFVWLYWGTNNGQSIGNNWRYTNSFGQRATGLLATNITGLNGSTTYYYRYYATNAAGATWAAPSTNFTTLTTPIIANNPATNITTNSASMNGYLYNTSGVPTFVRLYWGTTDGQSTNNNWQHTNSFGQRAVGTLTTNIMGLTANTTYYYRYYCTNSVGTNWASPSAGFATLMLPSAPAITNNDPTGISMSSASMNGNLASTGTLPTVVWLYWGTGDGQNTNNNWQHTNSFGQQGAGALTTNIAGLNAATIYYYRYFATNSAGANWAAPSKNLTTLTVPVQPPAPLGNYTSNSYRFVCFNNATIGMYGYNSTWDVNAGALAVGWSAPGLGTNVTDFSMHYQGDTLFLSKGVDIPSQKGRLIKWGDGSDSGIDYELNVTEAEGGQWLSCHPSFSDMQGDSLEPGTPAYMAFTVNGTNVLGAYSNQAVYASGRENDNTVEVKFSGFALTDRVDIAFIATAHSNARCSAAISKYTINGADSFTNRSILSPQFNNGGSWILAKSEYNGFDAEYDNVISGYFSMTNTSDYAYLSPLKDDMVLFTDIDPGADGVFTVTVELKLGGSIQNGWGDYINEESGGGLFDGFVLGLRAPPPKDGTTIILR